MRKCIGLLSHLVFLLWGSYSFAEIKVIPPTEAHRIIVESNDDNKPIVIDTRGGYKDYFRGHLPRAHHLNFDTLRGTDQGVPVQYLPDDLTRSLLQRAGVQPGRTHILYATGDRLPNDEILSATMVAYVLEKFGIEDIRIVDGGLAGWKSEKLPTTQEYFGNSISVLDSKPNETIGVSLTELLKAKEDPNTILVDARPKNEYLGNDDIWVRKGHIPGAVSFHWARLMDDANTHRFRSLASVQNQLSEAGLTPDKNIIVYCGTSREGSLLRFYLRYVAAYPKVRLYEGSWKEYASRKELPAERSESRSVVPKAK
ncbi:Putative thiosulfate sulfurtransferase precursor [Pirellula sp. SH-Sr6A]|uniref:sulfurtransferase n=1 Tax=Pirellula sp. SH-Sr6A TaxID=1632865 RepID=UPI00078E6CDB|nr:rhodanese-like domain-containing protein [Pirellula sp. SH-Sr6A]AMV31424.1 Putative thiosulfate sulfurtransferase precursor [Pirellula sp. SH-Sr6A]